MVAPALVVTCAHVVRSALEAGGPAPDGSPPVLLSAEGPAVGARVPAGGWFPGPLAGGVCVDLAVLVPDAPLAAAPARLGSCGEPGGREVAVYGYPAAAPHGLWAPARLGEHGGPHREWVRLADTGPAGARIGHGFSGAGVWDAATDRVIGLITAVRGEQGPGERGPGGPGPGERGPGEPQPGGGRPGGTRTGGTRPAEPGPGAPHTGAPPPAGTAWMLPMEAAVRLWPALGAEAGPPLPAAATGPAMAPDGRPRQRPGSAAGAGPRTLTPLLPSDGDRFEIADALLRIPQLADDHAAVLLRLLPPAIRHNIQRHSRARIQLFYAINTCADHREGRNALIAAVRLAGDESEPARAALELLDRLWPGDASGGGW
ncbi:trypsin-like peptidase domain-containing protein [Streptomyces sp. CAU 1734]|uniref:effector-associated domain 2-containing protein n=1 Tax=Streptomyces sp. CAU 1734 TaxID=3140360 RepID=UPI003260D8E3